MTVDQISIVALRVQSKDKYKNVPSVQRLKFSNKWWLKFSKNRGLGFRKICGNRKLIPVKELDEEKKRLPDIMKEFPDSSIFNYDETGVHLDYNGSYSFMPKNESIVPPKGDMKKRITFGVFSSAAGELLQPMVIDRSFSRSLVSRHIREARVGSDNGMKKRLYITEGQKYEVYRQKNAWMNKAIFEDVVRKFDKEMLRRNTTGLLLLDNFSGHRINFAPFKNTKPVFLMANTTGYIQPNDQGLYQTVKERFRKHRRTLLASQEDSLHMPNQREGFEALVKITMSISESLVKTLWVMAELVDPSADPTEKADIIAITNLMQHLDVQPEVDDAGVDDAEVDDGVIEIDDAGNDVIEIDEANDEDEEVPIADLPTANPNKRLITDYFLPGIKN